MGDDGVSVVEFGGIPFYSRDLFLDSFLAAPGPRGKGWRELPRYSERRAFIAFLLFSLQHSGGVFLV